MNLYQGTWYVIVCISLRRLKNQVGHWVWSSGRYRWAYHKRKRFNVKTTRPHTSQRRMITPRSARAWGVDVVGCDGVMHNTCLVYRKKERPRVKHTQQHKLVSLREEKNKRGRWPVVCDGHRVAKNARRCEVKTTTSISPDYNCNSNKWGGESARY